MNLKGRPGGPTAARARVVAPRVMSERPPPSRSGHYRSSPSRGRRPPTTTSASVAVIGAGFGGLACACALQRATGQTSKRAVSVKVFEKALDRNNSIRGEIHLPNAEKVLSILGLRAEYDRLRASSRSDRAHSVPIQDAKDVLASSLRSGTLRYGVQVIAIHRLQAGKSSCELADGKLEVFDVIIDASGLLAEPLHGAHAAIGDARAARGILYMGFRRLRYGADDALQDGAALGAALVASASATRFHPSSLHAALSSPACARYVCVRERRAPFRPTDALDVARVFALGCVAAAVAVALLAVAQTASGCRSLDFVCLVS